MAPDPHVCFCVCVFVHVRVRGLVYVGISKEDGSLYCTFDGACPFTIGPHLESLMLGTLGTLGTIQLIDGSLDNII